MTFNVVPAEGDYVIDLSGGGRNGLDVEPAPVKVRIRPATDSSEAAKISWQIGFREEQPVKNMQALNEMAWQHLRANEGGVPDETASVEATLDVDPNLPYRHTMDALSALSARRHQGERIELFRKVSLTRKNHDSR